MEMITAPEFQALYRQVTGKDLRKDTLYAYVNRRQAPQAVKHVGRTPLFDRGAVIGWIGSGGDFTPYGIEMHSGSLYLGSWHRDIDPLPSTPAVDTLIVPGEDIAPFRAALNQGWMWALKNAATLSPSPEDPWTVEPEGSGLRITGPFSHLRVYAYSAQGRQRFGHAQLSAEIEYRHLGHLIDMVK